MANVIIHNKLPQRIDISLLTAELTESEAVSLAPSGKTAAIDSARVTDYTKGLRKRGFIRIRSVS